ncbi:hypothetical protein LCGC14_3145530, partial [marine sediment metagenome]
MTNHQRRLLDLLKQHGFRKGTFTLASGKESDFYIDVRSVALSSEGHWLFGRVLMDRILEMPRVKAVAGVELGGCPLVSAVSYYGFEKSKLPALYVRKTPKGHGLKKLVEAPYGLSEGSKVVLVEDVVTSGGSSLRAIQSLTEAGFKVVGLIVVVDRKEGGLEAIKEAHPELVVASLFTRYDFIPEA